jgi:hypothetical protein
VEIETHTGVDPERDISQGRGHSPYPSKTATDVINTIIGKLPTGPLSARAGTYASPRAHGPWTCIEEGGKTTVFLPANLEALGDSPLHQAAVAACEVLSPHYEFSADTAEPHEPLDKKVDSYLQGISWALHDEGNGKLPVYRDVSGALGHAYYWVGHTALQQKFRTSTYFKGSGWHPTKGLTGKAWSADLDKSQKSIFALVTRAAKALAISENWRTWFRTKESFLGKEMKKSIPGEGTDILSVEEKEYLSLLHKGPISEYRKLLNELMSPSAELLSALPDKFKDVGRSLQPLSETVDKVLSHRLASAYPTHRRERQKVRKKPLKEILSELDITQYIFVMDPLVLGGMKPFRVDNPDGVPIETLDWGGLTASYSQRIRAVENSSPGLAEIARKFQAATFYVAATEHQA